ncbi:MAG: hypothetical protein IIC57_03555 [Proteobacteria bacterium]|nr:hypothetical protein [Pseudomonadota bacterium]
MLNPSERLFTFERIADNLSNGKARQKNRISNLLISDLWDGEIDPQKLFWNEYNARLVLDPGELPDDIPPSPDDFQETSREELYGLLSIVGERFASDRANFPRLAQIKLRQYSDDAQVILMNVAIPADEVRSFFDRNDLKTHKRYEQALTLETQSQNRPQSEAGSAPSGDLSAAPQASQATPESQAAQGSEPLEKTAPQTMGRRQQRSHETEQKYERWYGMSQDIKDPEKPRRPIEIARIIAKQETKAGNTKANAETIKRRLNRDFPGWAG